MDTNDLKGLDLLQLMSINDTDIQKDEGPGSASGHSSSSLSSRRPSTSARDLRVDTSSIQALAPTDSANLTPATVTAPGFSNNATPLATSPSDLTPKTSAAPLKTPLTSPTRAPQEASTSQLHSPLNLQSSPPIDSDQHSSGSSGSSSSGHEEEEDVDSHPLYKLLSTSPRPSLKTVWESTFFMILPPRDLLPDLSPLEAECEAVETATDKGFQFVRGAKGPTGELPGRDEDDRREALEDYVKMHAFKETQDSLVWISVLRRPDGQFRVRLDPSRNEVHIEWVTGSPPPRHRVPTGPVLPPLDETAATPVFESSPAIAADTTVPLELPPINAGAPLPESLLDAAPIMTSSPSRPRLRASASRESLQPKTFPIVTQNRVFRSKKPVAAPAQQSSPTQPPKWKGFKKWLRRSSFNAPQPKSRTYATSSEPVLDRIRLVAIDDVLLGKVAGWPCPPHLERRVRKRGGMSLVHHPSALELKRSRSSKSAKRGAIDPDGSSQGLIFDRLDGYRNFVKDVAYLVCYPNVEPVLQAILKETFVDVRARAREFARDYAVIAGLERKIAHRVRKAVVYPAWRTMSNKIIGLGPDGINYFGYYQDFLKRLIENVALGLLYPKLFLGAIVPMCRDEDDEINALLDEYRNHVSLPADFGVETELPTDIDFYASSIAALDRMHCHDAESMGLLAGRIQDILSSDDSPSLQDLSSISLVATPLGIVTCGRQAIDNVIDSLKASEYNSHLSPDDMIPLVTWLLVRSRARDLPSLVQYIRTFRLSSTLIVQDDYAFVTLQSALAFLRSDPLGLLRPPSPTIEPSSPHTSPRASRARGETGSSPRARRLSAQQPYRVPSRSISPQSTTSYASGRASGVQHKPSGRSRGHHGKMSDRRLSWQPNLSQQSYVGTSGPKRVSFDDDRASSRGRNSYESDRGYQVERQSLGFLPMASRSSLNISEIAASSTTVASRRQSLPVLQTAYDSHVRPRLVAATASSANSSFDRSVPAGIALTRSQSLSQPHPGSLAVSQDLQRSQSDNTAPRMSTETALSDSAHVNYFVGAGDPAARSISPAPSNATGRGSSELAGSLSDDHGFDWRGDASGATSPPTSSSGHHHTPSLYYSSVPSSPPLAPIPQIRERDRRYSTSAADTLSAFSRGPTSTDGAAAALSNLLLNSSTSRSGFGAARRPRPKSIMSLSSVSSLDHDAGMLSPGGTNDNSSHAASSDRNSGDFATLSASSRPTHARRSTTSFVWPDRPHKHSASSTSLTSLNSASSMGTAGVPTASRKFAAPPRVDHAVVTTFSRSLTADNAIRRDDTDEFGRRDAAAPSSSTSIMTALRETVPSVKKIGSSLSLRNIRAASER